jgi:hypothetical protein
MVSSVHFSIMFPQISLDELFLFIFPEHDVAKKAEKKRLKIIANRVKNMNTLMVQQGLKTTGPELATVSDDEIMRKRRRTSIMGSSGKSNGAGTKTLDLAAVSAQLTANLPTIAHVDDENDSSGSSDGDKISGHPVVVSARSINSFRGPLSNSKSGDLLDRSPTVLINSVANSFTGLNSQADTPVVKSRSSCASSNSGKERLGTFSAQPSGRSASPAGTPAATKTEVLLNNVSKTLLAEVVVNTTATDLSLKDRAEKVLAADELDHSPGRPDAADSRTAVTQLPLAVLGLFLSQQSTQSKTETAVPR